MDIMIDLKRYVDATPPCAVHLTSHHELLAFAACMTADGMPWAGAYEPTPESLKWALGEVETTGGIYAEVTTKYEGKWLRGDDDRVPAMYYHPSWSDLVAEQRYEVAELDEINEALRGKAVEQKEFIDNLDADNSRLTEANEKLEDEAVKHRSTRLGLDAEAARYRNEIERLKQENEKARGEAHSLHEQIIENIQCTEQITKSRDELSVQVEELTDENEELADDLKRLSDIRVKADSALSDNQALKARVEELTKESVARKEIIEMLSKDLNSANELTRGLSEENSELKDQVHQMKIDLAVAKSSAAANAEWARSACDQLLGYRTAVFEMQGIESPLGVAAVAKCAEA